MTKKTVKALAQGLAEQQWMMTHLASRLVELGILESGELKLRADSSPDKAEFVRDFVNHLVSIGLEIE
jgi:hypothetical protein